MTVPNAIGNFQIGISPIGTLPDFDVMQTVLSQYANSPIMMALVQNFYQYLDQTAYMDEFFDVIFNINTAQGYGLDMWGRIVGVSRVVSVQASLTLGFQEAGSLSALGFNQGAFYAGGSTTNNYSLADDPYRIVILAKAALNITDCAIPAINAILMSLFVNRGNCYVVDGLNMTMTYTFTFPTTDLEKAIVQGLGVLPKPTGVNVLYNFA